MIGSCGNLQFQSTIGALTQAYGECGGLIFSPPITGNEVISKTHENSDLQLQIFPNPAFDFIYIKNESTNNSLISIYDSRGCLVIQSNYIVGQPIDISDSQGLGKLQTSVTLAIFIYRLLQEIEYHSPLFLYRK
jgi:hypothetical protein